MYYLVVQNKNAHGESAHFSLENAIFAWKNRTRASDWPVAFVYDIASKKAFNLHSSEKTWEPSEYRTSHERMLLSDLSALIPEVEGAYFDFEAFELKHPAIAALSFDDIADLADWALNAAKTLEVIRSAIEDRP